MQGVPLPINAERNSGARLRQLSRAFYLERRNCRTMEKLKFYEVDKTYVAYLKRFDSKIPNISYDKHDKFICGVLLNINEMNYYAPISSFNRQQRTNILIKNRKGEVTSSIRLSFMFPVPDDQVKVLDFSKEEGFYKYLLMEENAFCNRHADEIRSKAEYIYIFLFFEGRIK